MKQLINKLKTALQKSLPGEDAQFLMAPLHRKKIDQELLNKNEFRPSAVMVALCLAEDNSFFIPLIERRSYNGAHSAQISLPGGKYDASDQNLQNTAIRECFEEIGLKEIEILGKLTHIHIPISNFLVHPYIGICTMNDHVFRLQEREVKAVLRLGLDQLLDDQLVRFGTVTLSNKQEIETAWFDVEGHKVWGATAMILSELKQLIKSIS